MLGRYRLQRSIGQGGMAEVYLAYDEHLRREIAIKIVHRGRTNDLARFQREAEMLATLTHEHILPVYDYGQEGPWHYLVMPYVSHGTLADRLRTRGPFTMEEAGLLLEQVASALQYAHEQGILHRDIKPSNILLRDDGYAYLADFGIARLLQRESGLTQTGLFIGTPEYMAPEIFEDQSSQSSDIYALGVVLYLLLTGRVPFTGSNLLAIIEQQRNTPPMAPSQLNPMIPPSIERVVLCALEKDPRRRFQSASAFANAYRHALPAYPLPPAQRANATTGFYADPTMAMRPMPLAQPGSQPHAGFARPASAPQKRRPLALIVSVLLVLALLLVGSLVAALTLESHASNQASVSPTTTVSTSTLVPTATATQPASTCNVNDTANVLDQQQICQAASQFPYSLVVNASRTSSSNGSSSPSTYVHTVVITIVIGRHHGHEQAQVTITGDSSVALTQDQYHAAEGAFNQAAQDGDYTSATIAAIQSLQQGNTQ